MISFSQEDKEDEVTAYMKAAGYDLSISDYAYLKEGEVYYYTKTFYSGNYYDMCNFKNKSPPEKMDYKRKQGII